MQSKGICVHCHKPVFRARNGDWYHRHSASTACYFPSGSVWRAEPKPNTVTLRGSENKRVVRLYATECLRTGNAVTIVPHYTLSCGPLLAVGGLGHGDADRIELGGRAVLSLREENGF